MAFVYRAEKGKGSFLQGGSTTDAVGPGRYESTGLSPRKIPEGAATAPFTTTEVRECQTGPKTTFQETPGPGNYLGPEVPRVISPRNGIVSGFRSGVARLHTDKSSNAYNPGPGSYYEESSWVRKSHRVPREAPELLGPETSATGRVQFLAARGPPSIPNRDFSYGYEEDREGRLTRLMPEEQGYSGRGADVVGPGRYSWDVNKVKGSKGTDFSRGKADRRIFDAKDTPGPGSYLDPTLRVEPLSPSRSQVGGQSSSRILGGPSASFSAATLNADRVRNQARSSAAFKSSFDRFRDTPSCAPPPTKYDVQASGPKKPEGRKVDRLGFGSTMPLEYELDDARMRHAPTNIKNPGPAFYNLTGEIAAKKKGGAVSGFKSATNRFKENTKAAKLPGPGAYELAEEALSLAGTVSKKIATSSRYGPFGATSTRFPEDSVAGMNRKIASSAAPAPGSYDPPTAVSGYKMKEKKPHSVFASSTDRFGATLPDVVVRDLLTGDVVDVRPQRPAPGQYDLPDPWNKSHRATGVKRDAFGSQGARIQGLVDKSALDLASVGPGTYSPVIPSDTAQRLEVPSAFISQAKRFNEYKTASPGPSQFYLRKSMVKPSFNVTYDAGVTA